MNEIEKIYSLVMRRHSRDLRKYLKNEEEKAKELKAVYDAVNRLQKYDPNRPCLIKV